MTEPIDLPRIERAVREILLAIGEDPDRDGLADTPARVARAYAEQFSGLSQHPEDVLGTLRSEVIFKPGEAPYVRTNSQGLNLWGARSATMLDPSNDTEFWTLQEFAASALCEKRL